MINISYVISALSVLVALGSLVYAVKTNFKKETREESIQLTTVIVKLENIQSNVNSIRDDMKDIKEVSSRHTVELARIDESLKSAWKQINLLGGRKDEE